MVYIDKCGNILLIMVLLIGLNIPNASAAPVIPVEIDY
jgi:hypothetical protein